MSDFWFGFIMFLVGFTSCFAIFFVLCYLKEIRETVNLIIWDIKHFLREKGLMK